MNDRKYTPARRERGPIDQYAYRFDNGFGAMVTYQPRPDEYGEWGWWELAVVRYTAPGTFEWDFVNGTEVAPHDAVLRLGSSPYDAFVEEQLAIIESWPADYEAWTEE